MCDIYVHRDTLYNMEEMSISSVGGFGWLYKEL